MSIKTAILAMIKDQIVPTNYVGKIVSVDTSKLTCEVDLQTMPNVFDVRLTAAINSVEKGLIIIPKVDSIVLIARIENKIESSFVIGYTEIDTIKILPETGIELFGDGNGGLVISGKVSQQINALKNEINSLKSAFSTWIPVPQDGGASLKALITPFASAQMSQSAATDFENKKVKHGE